MLSKQDFFEAVEKGDLEKVKSILESKRDKYGSPCYPDTVKEIVSHDNGLTMAARLGHDDILKYLLDYGMDPNARTGERNQSALHYAAMKDFRNITGLLLKYKPNHKIECVRKKSLDINIKDRKDQTPLLLAVSENHTEIVKMLLNAGADPNICNFRQVTPLIISSYRGNTAITKLLLDNNADPDLRDDEGITALMYACYKGHSNIVSLLIDARTDMYTQTLPGSNLPVAADAFMIACRYGYLQTAQLFIDKGYDVNCRKTNRKTPLMFLIENTPDSPAAAEDIATLLIKSGADINAEDSSGKTPLILASSLNIPFMTDILLRQGARTEHHESFYGDTALHIAAEKGFTETAKILLDFAADANTVNTKKETPLAQACRQGFFETARLLLKRHANPDIADEEGNTALMSSVRNGYIDIAELLLRYNADLNLKNNRGQTASDIACENPAMNKKITELLISASPAEIQFLCAAKEGQTDKVLKYLAEGIDADRIRNKSDGKNALLSACQKDQREVIQILLDHNVSVHVRDNSGSSPLHYLSGNDANFPVTERIISLGGDVNAETHHKITPLMYAAAGGAYRTAELLLSHGASVNARDMSGFTPVLFASMHNRTQTALLLSRHGADLQAKNHYGYGGLWYAKQHENRELVSLFKESPEADYHN